MQNILNPDKKRELAFALYSYFGEAHPVRKALLKKYQQDGGTLRGFYRRMENQGEKLSEAESDWIIETLMPEITSVPLRNIFLRTVGNVPEEFGYQVKADHLESATV